MVEIFMAFYSGNQYEEFMILNRIQGPYRVQWHLLLLCNVLAPQLIWVRKVRRTPWMVWVVAMFVNVGMWLERFVIVVTSLHRDFVPSSWGMFHGTFWDWATFIGTIGLFLSLLFLFLRFLPMISIFEMRTIVPEPDAGLDDAASEGDA
jgi:molybdopterin-containing oxidoreductase family membrane subunit